jgi:hypothetical protein
MSKVGAITGAIIAAIGAFFMGIAGIELLIGNWNLNSLSVADFIFKIISICLTFTCIAFIGLAIWFQFDEPGDTFTGGINLVVGFIAFILTFVGSLFNVQLIGYLFSFIIPSSGFLLVIHLDALFILGGGAIGLL